MVTTKQNKDGLMAKLIEWSQITKIKLIDAEQSKSA